MNPLFNVNVAVNERGCYDRGGVGTSACRNRHRASGLRHERGRRGRGDCCAVAARDPSTYGGEQEKYRGTAVI